MKNIVARLVLFSLGATGVCSYAWADGAEEAMPSFYEEPGISRTRDYINQNAHEKIDPFTGKLQWHYVDLFIPGNGGFDLKVQRSYTLPFLPEFNSPPWEPAPNGLGWTIHFGRVLRNATTVICDTVNAPFVDPVLELPDGSRPILRLGPSAAEWFTTDLWRAECNLSSPSMGLNVFSPDGIKYEMTHLGHQIGTLRPQQTYYATRISDRNGNFMDIAYTTGVAGTTVVSGVTTSDGRTLTFNYTNGKLDTITDGSRTWTYVYGGGVSGEYPYLKEVLRPGGTKWVYDYNEATTGGAGDFALRRVTYPQGGTIDYTYDFVFFAQTPSPPRSTVVKTKVANPGGTWTWTYTPASQVLQVENGVINFQIPPTPEQAAQVDQTAVTGPDGYRTHYHVGYNSVFSGIVYLMGWQLGSVTGTNYFGGLRDTQYSGFSPTSILISNRTNKRGGGLIAEDANTLAPLMAVSTVSRDGQVYQARYNNYDNFGNPQEIVEVGTNTRTTGPITYFIDPAKWVIRKRKDETISEGAETLAIARTFDPNGNMLSETRAGVTTGYTYTSQGDVASRTNARNKTWSYADHFRGIPQTENQPEAVAVTRVVSPAGNITSDTDGELATTGYSYDGLNRVTGVTHAFGNPVTVTWTQNTRTVSRGAYREVTTYDGFAREARIDHTDTARAETVSQVFNYDSLGRRSFASYLNNPTRGTGYEYDIENQLLAVFHEANPAVSTWTSLREYFYAVDTVHVINERNFEFRFKYRSYADPGKRELIKVTPVSLPAATTDITRNLTGQLTSVTQDGVTRTYGYDTHFYLTSIVDPETGTTTLGRDAVGNMTSRQVAGSGVTTYVYDDRNRNTAINYPAGTPSVVLTYFKDDKPKSTDNGFARCDYTYDANKNLKTDALAIGARTFLTQYGYDANDALASLTYGSGRVVSYGPDAFGRPRQAGPYITSVAYHPNGQPSSIAYANGVTTAIGLNTRQWPSTLSIAKSPTTFNNQTYLYDPLGNVSSISDSANSSYNRGMGYDALDRLSSISGPWGGGSIGYDGRGNITSQALGAFNLAYTYDPASQRLTSVSGSKAYNLTYDAYGNVANNGSTSFAYNDAPNLRCANCGLPNEIAFDYDGKNQRVRLLKGGVETFFVYGAGGQLLAEETPNSKLKEYVYLGGKQVAVREQPLP
jgi:YD repeat-containing protein